MTPASCDIAIIGGGFSGMMTAYHLVTTAATPLKIALIEPSGTPGRGLAYSTTNPHHLLNVRAKNMSALPALPRHFLDWLNSQSGQAAAAELDMPCVAWQGVDFAPRALYARYLDTLWQDAQAQAETRGITLQHIKSGAHELKRIEGRYQIKLDNSATITAAQCLLALGNLPQSAATPTAARFIQQVWRADMTALAASKGPVAMIGTGLTMIDMVISLRDAGYKGKIIGLSRSARLPLPHDVPQSPYISEATAFIAAPQTLSKLLKAFRREARAHHWQAVIDQWRPHLVQLWQSLSPGDRRRFLSRHFTRWNIHRHRMAPLIAVVIEAEIAGGTLILRQGPVHVTAQHDHVDISSGNDVLRCAYALDCRGPGYDLRRGHAPLLTGMIDTGLMQPHPTGWGAAVDDDLQMTGQPGLYAIGPLAIGARLETTAVPELRQQAADIAASLLKCQVSRISVTKGSLANSG